ncbi:MAG: amidohydrolase family protein [Bacillota bacterium]|nr:amidohydrolase family protein [Bacillota bacterium]
MTLIIKNAKVYDMVDIFGQEKILIIENGKILAIKDLDEKIDENGSEIFDAQGKIVSPGLVEPSCSLGLKEAIYPDGNDLDEKSNPINPKLRALDGVKITDQAFEDALKAGVTSLVTGPGSANIIGGTCLAMKTFGKDLESMIMEDQIAYKFSLGMGPKYAYGSKGKAPITRMGTAALLRQALSQARDYKNSKKKDFNMDLEALSRVFDGMLVKIEARQVQDIVTAVRIAEEFGLNYTIDRAAEAYLIPDFIKDHQVKLVYGPVYGGKRDNEVLRQEGVGGKILQDQGVSFATSCNHPEVDISTVMVNGLMMVRKKMSGQELLKSMTINAAKMVGLDHRIGSLEVGKDADIVVWSGDPLDLYSKAEAVFVNGQRAL